MLKCLTFMFLLFWGGSARALAPNLHELCLKMYQKSLSKSRRQNVCSCVVQNLQDRFDKGELQELQQIYGQKFGRHEAGKDEIKKAFVEFDSRVHAQCLQNPLWRLPAEDLGRPDEL